MTPADVLDLLLLLLVVLYMFEGARRGFLRTAALAIGFVGGGLLGFTVVPGLLGGRLAGFSPVLALVVLASVVLVFAMVGQALTMFLARMVGLASSPRVGALDAIAGALITGGLALCVAWLGAGLVRVAMPGDVARVVGSSRVLAAVDRVMPVSSADVLDRAHTLFEAYDFPRVFEGVGAEPIKPVEAADPGAAKSPAIQRAGGSVVRIDATASACGRMQEGSGFVVAPGVVVTNAHVVSGSSRVVIRKDRLRSTATVIAFDPARDLAILSVDTGDLPVLALSKQELSTGDNAVVAGYPLGGPMVIDSARTRERITARGRDIYGQGAVVRDIYALRVPIQPGNSGGPLLTPQGDVVGIVFARSLDDSGTAYALSLAELQPVLEAARAGVAVSAGSCVA
ncbi:MarP family serine protease [Gephyromycinifex aptenodytis]|uniref:MarP family serine protease n=1 Tax=Gephyromycinifex aptenodytis TaxID=2716227 RepID=UPI001444F28B|nr:MarP family serine protease [Gephyromycinifex aptenodytis]